MNKPFYWKIFLIITFLSSSKLSQGQCDANFIHHWESCVLDNQSWKYRVPTAAIANWTSPLFNDASWTVGTGGIGFGDGDDNTSIPTNSVSVYMRRSFNIVDTSLIHSAYFCMDFDDGFIAYLNGIEIARSNMAVNPAYNALATASHEAQLYQGYQPNYYLINAQALDTILKNGTNVLCIQTHNAAANSNDLTSRPFLQLSITNATYNYSPTPAWFTPPYYLQTKLPIISINTLGQNIVDDPRIICDMGIINNGPGNLNCILDPFNDYNGKISIEFRGSTSQMFPKKPYGFSTVDALGNNVNVSLLGYPKEHDWVLLNPYTDKTFMRDVITHDLGRAMGNYTSRTQFVELVINGQLQGVYVLLEKIKVDKNRVDIEKITPTMNSGDSLTGGYIFKIDKTTGNAGNWWNTTQGVSIQTHDPNWLQITAAQNNYLTNYINNFENVLWGPNYNNPNTGYRKLANVYSFVDFFIINEISNNIDGYRLSTFVHKDRDSKCGRFTMGPYWDFNLSFGNGDYCNGYPYTGWQMYQGCGDGSSKWVDRMLQDQWFKNLLNCRWNELRQNILSTPNVLARIDTYANYVRQASVRDSAIWQTIGTYVWPNGWIANSWQGEIDSMKLWVSNRMNWIDANMFAANQACNSNAGISLVVDEINFHSDSTTDAGDWLELYNYGATTLNISNAVILDGDTYEKYCVIPNNTTLAPGARLVVYADSVAFATKFPAVTNKIGPLCFKLSNGGQKIVMRDKDNKLIFSVDYLDTWQCATDGNGRTLQLTAPAANLNLASSWYAGCMGGSPGVAYTPCVENLIYSEINYNSSVTADAGDWIELHNKNASPFPLAGWSIRDGSSNNVYYFQSGTSIPPTGYLVVYSDGVKFSTQHPGVTNKVGPLGFGFSSTGDVARVFDNTGKLRFSVCYGTANPWPTTPNAGGYTLENAQYTGNHNAATTWFAGCLKGSPGVPYTPCWPVATPDITKDDYITLYPNPAKTTLHIESSLTLGEIIIYDNIGRAVQKTLLTNKTIDIASLPNGVYHLQCKSAGNVYNVKFVKGE
ncbi:MAG: CotH kinase family protein [Bacteroidetes bacterium]|nr:CotH kinase family protein [Bacteroidota bacterium]